MKTLIILLAIIGFCHSGHIFVEDPQLKWQNTGYFSTAVLRFSLENQISSTDYLQIYWPFTWITNSLSLGTMLQQGGTTISQWYATAQAAGTPTISASGSGQTFYVNFGTALSAGVWYTLTLVGPLATTTNQIYNDPIRLVTVSAAGTANYVIYDENLSAGIIAIDAAPGTLNKVQVSPTSNVVTAPNSVTANKAVEAQYKVYIDIQPTKDYLGGAFLVYVIDSPFKFIQTCQSESNLCATGADVSCVNTTADSGSCAISSADTTSATLLFELKGQFLHTNYYRISATVQNPSFYQAASAGLKIYTYSRAKDSYFYYEIYTSLTGQFSVSQYTVTDVAVQLFWGLYTDTAATYGCPIVLYSTSTASKPTNQLKIWNKVQVFFSVSTGFSQASNAVYQFTLSTGMDLKPKALAKATLALPSIASSVPLVTGKKLSCSVDTSAQTFTCSNVAALLGSTTYFVAFSIQLDNGVTAPTALGVINFGQAQLNAVTNLPGTYTTITTGSTGTALTVWKNDEYLGGYASLGQAVTGKGVQVVDSTLSTTDLVTVATTTRALWLAEVNNILKTAGNAKTRSALRQTSSTFNLVFLIDPTIDQICCKTIANVQNCAAASLGCGTVPSTTTAQYNDYIIFKIIANPQVLDFSSVAAAGVYIPPGGFLSSDTTWCNNDATAKCGVYNSTKTTFVDQQNVSQLNIWTSVTQTTSKSVSPQKYQMLSLTCSHQLTYDSVTNTALKYCVSTTSYSATGGSEFAPAVTVPGIKFISTFRSNPLYPSSTELDFIVCFRFFDNPFNATAAAVGNIPAPGNAAITNTTFSATVDNTLASSGVLQAQIFVPPNSKDTVFRFNLLLGTKDATGPAYNGMSVIPVLLRVGGNVNSGDFSGSPTSIILFLDSQLALSSSTLASAYAAACTSSTDSSSSLTCQQITSQESNTDYYYYPVMQRIIINSAVTAGTNFNHYVILQSTAFETLVAVQLAFVTSSNANYVSTGTFTLFGYGFTKALNPYYSGTGNLAAVTSGVIAPPASDATNNFLNTPGTAAASKYTCTIANSDFTTALGGANNLYGGYSATNIAIPAYTAGGACTGTALAANYFDKTAVTDNDNGGRTNGGLWGTHFFISSIYSKYWLGATVNSSFVASDTAYTSCSEISYQLATADVRQRYVLICPIDKISGSIDITSTSNKITFSKFALPFYVGGSASGVYANYFKNIVEYFLSGNTGIFGASAFQVGSGLSQGYAQGSACTVNAQSAAYMQSGVGQKVNFQVTTKLQFDLSYSATLNTNQIVLTQIFSIAPTGMSLVSNNNGGDSCLADNNLQCSLDLSSIASPVFTLTSQLATSATSATHSIAAGTINVYYWITADGTAQTTATNYAKFQYKNPATVSAQNELLEVHTCNSTAVAWGSSGTYQASVSVTGFNFLKTATSRGAFDITWTINKNLLSFSKFILTSTFWATANTATQGKNVRCNVWYGSQISNDFLTIDISDLSSVKLLAKTTSGQAGILKYDFTPKSFTFRCLGTQAPNPSGGQMASSDNVKVDFQDSGASVAYNFDVGSSGTPLAAKTRTQETITTVAAPTGTSWTASIALKSWQDAGMCSVYTFLLKLTGATSYSAGLWIIVEFSAAVPPKLNRKGALLCEQGYNSTLSATYCYFETDRRIRILSNAALDNNTSGYKFAIHCVENPKTLDTFANVYFAIENAGALQYQIELADTAIGTAAPSIVQILDYQVNANQTRTNVNFQFDVLLKAGQVALDQELYVQFSGDYLAAFYKGFSPSCSLYRFNDDWTLDSNSFVGNCTYLKHTRVLIYLKADTNSQAADKRYRLQVQGVPSPLTPIGGYTYPTLIFPTKGGTVLSYRSSVGVQNTSFYGFGRQNLASFSWATSLIKTKVGLYSGVATLQPEANADGSAAPNFVEALTFSTSTSGFSFNPNTFSVVGGAKVLTFGFAPKATTSPGQYWIQFSTSNTNYAPIVPLQVYVVNEQCTISVPSPLNFPIKGSSLPFVLDFSNCIPETSASLKLYAHNTTTNGSVTAGFDSKNFTVDGSVNKEYTVQFGATPSIQFTLQSTDQTTTAATVGKLVFVWTTTGANSASYATISPQTVSSVVADTTTVVLQQSVQTIAGAVQVTFKCDLASVYYYAVSLSNSSLVNMQFATIKAKSLDLNLPQTYPTNDSNLLIYGYQTAYTANTQQTFNVYNVMSQAAYFLYGVCVNTGQNVTAVSQGYQNWTQTDNGGRPVLTSMTFSTPLSTSQVDSSCAAFAVATGQFCNRTVCPDATNACGNKIITSSSNSTRRRILANITNCLTYSTSNSSLCASCNTSYVVSLDKLSCISSCPSGQQNVSGACIVSTATSYVFTTSPNPFIAADTTYADITKAVVTNAATFNKLFAARAGLPSTITYQTPTILPQLTGTLIAPTITASVTVQSSSAALFSATLAKSDGFVFAGYTGKTSTKPTQAQIKQSKNANGSTLGTLFYTFAKNNVTVSTTWSGLTAGTTYTAVWFASNQDPVYGLTSDVGSQDFTTQGNTPITPTFAPKVSTTFFALLALLFVLFILI